MRPRSPCLPLHPKTSNPLVTGNPQTRQKATALWNAAAVAPMYRMLNARIPGAACNIQIDLAHLAQWHVAVQQGSMRVS